ncbi:MAG: PDZ domain-containing protein [Planctomycetota bacterium]|nr:PDZ domain-containing protein [Planctomycetota bacterium]
MLLLLRNSLPMILIRSLTLSLLLFFVGFEHCVAQSETSVNGLVKQLSNRRFIDREQATLDLIDRGTEIIPDLLEQLEEQNFEGITRSLHILSELTLSNKQGFKANGIPRQSLEKLASSANNRVARQAASALDRINAIREGDAIRGLTKLGARYNRIYTRMGAESRYVQQLHLDGGWQGNAEDLYMLPWVSSAEELFIEGLEINEQWFAIISRMRKLTSLVVKRCPLTDTSAKHIAKLTALTNLDIRYCPITDAGFDQLHPLKKLAYVKLYGTKGTKEGADRLQQAIKSELDFRLGAFLGVGCRQPPAACYIESVQPNTGAAKAGLMVGDIITAFDDRPVQDFTDLRRIISGHRPGDKSKVAITRIGIPKTGAFNKKEGTTIITSVKPHVAGVMVETISEDCPLYKAGLRKGHVVTNINAAEIKTSEEFDKVLQGNPIGPIRFVYSTNAKEIVIDVEFGEWD